MAKAIHHILRGVCTATMPIADRKQLGEVSMDNETISIREEVLYYLCASVFADNNRYAMNSINTHGHPDPTFRPCIHNKLPSPPALRTCNGAYLPLL